jgi:hypothetical protein
LCVPGIRNKEHWMKLGFIAAAVGTLLLSATPAFCDLIPNSRQAPLVVVNLDGSHDAPSATEALMEGSLENNTYLHTGADATATDPVNIGSDGSIEHDRSVTLPASGLADPAPSAVTATPEPGSLVLFGLGAILAAAAIRRKLSAEQQ